MRLFGINKAKLQRAAMFVWPVTVLVLTPLFVIEAVNLWRKNKSELSNNKPVENGDRARH